MEGGALFYDGYEVFIGDDEKMLGLGSRNGYAIL